MNNWKKVFAIIWTGQFFSILTSSLVNFAIILWLTFETKSAETLAFATIAAMFEEKAPGAIVSNYTNADGQTFDNYYTVLLGAVDFNDYAE